MTGLFKDVGCYATCLRYAFLIGTLMWKVSQIFEFWVWPNATLQVICVAANTSVPALVLLGQEMSLSVPVHRTFFFSQESFKAMGNLETFKLKPVLGQTVN